MKRATTALAALLMVGSLAAAPPASAQSPTALFPMVLDGLRGPVAGQPVEVDAVLASGTTPLAGEQVTLLVRPYGATGFAVAGKATTGADGLASVAVTLARNAAVRWTFAGDTSYAPTWVDYSVQVAAGVRMRVNDRTLRRGQRLVVRGRTFPAKAGCTVKLWRGELRPLMVGPRPVHLATATVRPDGTYRLVRRFHRKARMRIAVTVPACAGNSRGLSSYVRIRIR